MDPDMQNGAEPQEGQTPEAPVVNPGMTESEETTMEEAPATEAPAEESSEEPAM